MKTFSASVVFIIGLCCTLTAQDRYSTECGYCSFLSRADTIKPCYIEWLPEGAFSFSNREEKPAPDATWKYYVMEQGEGGFSSCALYFERMWSTPHRYCLTRYVSDESGEGRKEVLALFSATFDSYMLDSASRKYGYEAGGYYKGSRLEPKFERHECMEGNWAWTLELVDDKGVTRASISRDCNEKLHAVVDDLQVNLPEDVQKGAERSIPVSDME